MTDKTKSTSNREYFIDVARVLAFSSVLVGHKFWNDFLNIINQANPNIALASYLKPAFAGGPA
jgi:hypothetical protein